MNKSEKDEYFEANLMDNLGVELVNRSWLPYSGTDGATIVRFRDASNIRPCGTY